MENGNSDSKSNWNRRLRKLESCSVPSVRGVHSHDLPDTQRGKNPGYLLPGIARSLFPSQDDQTLSYFYEFMMGTMPEPDHSRYLHLQLPALVSRSRQDSALYLAAQAISHAVVRHFSIIGFVGVSTPHDYQFLNTPGIFRCLSSHPLRPPLEQLLIPEYASGQSPEAMMLIPCRYPESAMYNQSPH